MSAERNREALLAYLEGHDATRLAEDAVFTDMSSGQVWRGREAIGGMLDAMYHQLFDAHAETKNLIVDDEHAVLEADFVGRHIGDFAGVPATGKEVSVPLAVIYDFRDGQILAGRVFWTVPVFLAQVGAASPSR
jgi:steroid delta-isomerase-like uncharacterized protein